jgi:hypothetical protein
MFRSVSYVIDSRTFLERFDVRILPPMVSCGRLLYVTLYCMRKKDEADDDVSGVQKGKTHILLLAGFLANSMYSATAYNTPTTVKKRVHANCTHRYHGHVSAAIGNAMRRHM